MVNTLHFHCRHVGSIPSQGTKIQQVHSTTPHPSPPKKKGIVWPLASEPGSKCQWLQGFVSSCSGKV